jgi:hypothetical protein
MSDVSGSTGTLYVHIRPTIDRDDGILDGYPHYNMALNTTGPEDEVEMRRKEMSHYVSDLQKAIEMTSYSAQSVLEREAVTRAEATIQWKQDLQDFDTVVRTKNQDEAGEWIIDLLPDSSKYTGCKLESVDTWDDFIKLPSPARPSEGFGDLFLYKKPVKVGLEILQDDTDGQDTEKEASEDEDVGVDSDSEVENKFVNALMSKRPTSPATMF